MKRISLAVLLLFVAVAFAQDKPTTKPIGANRVENGGFEKAESWGFSAVNGCQGTGGVTTEQAHSGDQSYKITNKTGFAPHVYARTFQPIGGLEPYTTYRISCYVKGTSAGICWIGGGNGWSHRKAFPKGTFGWTYQEITWVTDANAGDYELMIATESPTAALYVDDVKFEPISVDAAKRDAALAKYKVLVVAQQKHLDEVRALIAAVPGAAMEPSIQLGVTIARRYLDRVTTYPARQSPIWSIAQLEEIDVVLKETVKELALFKSQDRKPQPLDFPTGGPVTVRDGIFYTDTTSGKDKPWFFYGMGHFSQVMDDLPNWRDLAVTIVQDGRAGPNSMEKDGTFRESGRKVVADLGRAGIWNVKTDYLLSPHYFPDWVWPPANTQEHKDLAAGSGTIYFNLDHPLAKDAVGRWADLISKAFKDHKALFSICLTNEPTYGSSGKNKESLPIYQAYLKDLHHNDIEALNKLYGTTFASFDKVTAPTWGYTNEDTKNRAFYDWQRFNKKHFAQWHGWLSKTLKKNLPDIPTHAKIMIFFSMNRGQMGDGVDAEDFTDNTDLAGCDAYAFPDGDYKSYDWRGHEFWYDLLNSFHNQPVFNSENHVIPDGTGPVHIPATMTRAQYWQGALHHQGVTTTWVWEEPRDPALTGSIYLRPANAYGAGRAFVDLGHFAEEVAAINQSPADVALLYSQPSIFWQESYQGAIQDFYTHLNFLGQKTTFVSEKMLQTGRIPKVKYIALTQATHVEDATIEALKKYVTDGGKVILVGAGNLAFDQYHRKRDNIPAELSGAPMIDFAKASEADKHQALFDFLMQQGIAPVELRDSDSGKLAWNVEYRVVRHNGAALVPMINFAKTAVNVKGPSSAGQKAVDLLSGEVVSGDEPVKLEPMVPRLFRAQ